MLVTVISKASDQQRALRARGKCFRRLQDRDAGIIRTDAGRQARTDAGRDAQTHASRHAQPVAGRHAKTHTGRQAQTHAGADTWFRIHTPNRDNNRRFHV